MRLTHVVQGVMLVLVVILVPMGVVVLQLLMGMLMRVMFPEKKQDPYRHQRRCKTFVRPPSLS